MAQSLNQPSFAAGELSPELRRRIDLQKYSVGAEIIQNMIVLPRGGVQSRPGTQYVSEVKNSAKITRLIDFVFSTTQAYVLEFGDQYIRFYMNGGVIMNGSVPYEVATTYLEAELAALKFEQSADTLYITHPNHAPATLTRTGHTVWTLANFPFINGPLRAENDTAATLLFYLASDHAEVNAVEGDTIDLVSSAALFLSTHVGGSFAIRHLSTATSYSFVFNENGSFTQSCATVSGDATVTVPIIAAMVVGMGVSGTGIPVGATIITVDASTIEISAAATATATNTLTFTPSGIYRSGAYPVWGDWNVTFVPGSAKIDGSNMFIERSVDEGITWYKIHTIAKTSSDTSIEISGSDIDPALIRIGRETSAADNCSVSVNSLGHLQWAVVKITGVTDATHALGVLQTDFDNCGTAFKTWAEGSWSPYRGWPSVVSFYQDRLCFGCNASEPNAFWDSKTGDYVNFGKTLPAVDDDAINSRLMGRTVNAISWMVPMQAHIMLTTDSEWTVEPSISGQFTASTTQVRQLTYYGSEGTVEPVIIGDTVMFVQRNGAKIRAMTYDDVNGKGGADLSVMANHLFDGYSIVDWAYQQTPHSVLWCVRSDGALLSFTYHKEHEVWAWARHDTDGLFESVASIPGVGQDDVYFIVKRTIGGAVKRYVELLAHRDATSLPAFFGVDCGLTYSGAATATISGLAHLEGKAVAVLADGVEVRFKTVTNGSITLPKAAALVHVGLPFTWRLRTLQIDASSKYTGLSSDKKKLVPGATISVLNSYGGQAGDSQFVTIPYPSPSTSPALLSDDIKITLLNGWKKEGQFEIKGDGVYPMHIINLMPVVQVGGN